MNITFWRLPRMMFLLVFVFKWFYTRLELFTGNFIELSTKAIISRFVMLVSSTACDGMSHLIDISCDTR